MSQGSFDDFSSGAFVIGDDILFDGEQMGKKKQQSDDKNIPPEVLLPFYGVKLNAGKYLPPPQPEDDN